MLGSFVCVSRARVRATTSRICYNYNSPRGFPHPLPGPVSLRTPNLAFLFFIFIICLTSRLGVTSCPTNLHPLTSSSSRRRRHLPLNLIRSLSLFFFFLTDTRPLNDYSLSNNKARASARPINLKKKVYQSRSIYDGHSSFVHDGLLLCISNTDQTLETTSGDFTQQQIHTEPVIDNIKL